MLKATAPIDVIISLLGLIFLLFWLIAFSISHEKFIAHYQHNFQDARRERLFLSSVSFFITFAVARLIAYSIHINSGPFNIIKIRGIHIHHMVIGIIILLATGYLWLCQIGIGVQGGSRWMSALTSIFFGIGAALALDEFALWINLKDVYWSEEGRKSIDAVILFGAILSIGVWGDPFFRSLLTRFARNFRNHRHYRPGSSNSH
jgi:hypothetical protein